MSTPRFGVLWHAALHAVLTTIAAVAALPSLNKTSEVVFAVVFLLMQSMFAAALLRRSFLEPYEVKPIDVEPPIYSVPITATILLGVSFFGALAGSPDWIGWPALISLAPTALTLIIEAAQSEKAARAGDAISAAIQELTRVRS